MPRQLKVFVAIATLAAGVGCADSRNSSSPAPASRTEPTKFNAPAKPSTLSPPADIIPAFKDESGFYALDDLAMSTAHQGHAGSVFKIVVPVAQYREHLSTLLWYPAYRIYHIRISKLSDIEKQVMIRQIENCEQNRRFLGLAGEECEISSALNTGTAFLAVSGDSLWTSTNVAGDALTFPIGNGERAPEVFVFDAKNNLMVDPFKDQLEMIHGQKAATVTDGILRLSLSKAIGSPLTVAAQEPKAGESISVIGYPWCTKCEQLSQVAFKADFTDRAPRPNSDGQSVRVSFGQVATHAYYNLLFNRTPPPAPNLITTTADSVPGTIGAPAFNAQGEVIGVVSETTYKDIDGHRRRATAITAIGH